MSDLLEGVRVIEVASLLNGDTVGMRLGDMGADVIKVEAPPAGDYVRDINGVLGPRCSTMHLHVNRNKRSIAVDLRTPAGIETFWRLLDTADVCVDGLLPGATDRLGIGYEAQRARKPSIVYCQYTGYGATGPYSRLPTHGQMMDALAAAFPRELGPDGLMRPPAERRVGGRSGGEGTAAGAVHAALHVVAALVRRQRTGQGCYIDVAASDAIVAQAWVDASSELNRGRVLDPEHIPQQDVDGLTGAKYQYYETADRKVVLLCAIEHRFWDAFCHAVGRPDLASRKNTDTPVDFGADPALRRELQAIFHQRTQQAWIELALKHRIPIGPAPRDFAEMREDPHVRQRRAVFEAEHPVAGPYTHTGEGAIVDGKPFAIRRHAPAYGEHSAEILRELGVSLGDHDGPANDRTRG
jgi:crotonobetainyl-CoA:carnitine CoA-transferase CaiB-like acyl-CoA transferase